MGARKVGLLQEVCLLQGLTKKRVVTSQQSVQGMTYYTTNVGSLKNLRTEVAITAGTSGSIVGRGVFVCTGN